jgi:hypothetical protein
MQYDFISINKNSIKAVAGGGIRLKGTLASSGWLEYKNGDGTSEMQFVPIKTLFDKDYVESLYGMPVTLFHPDDPVTPTNYRDLTVGTLLNITCNQKDKCLEGEIAINDRQAIESVLSKSITDLSMGYEVDKENIKGNEYTQTKRRGNHISLVPEGRDRKARLHLDADGLELVSNEIVIPKKILIRAIPVF